MWAAAPARPPNTASTSPAGCPTAPPTPSSAPTASGLDAPWLIGITDVRVLDTGKILIGGYVQNPIVETGRDFLLIRLNPDGSMDRDFGLSGVQTFATPPWQFSTFAYYDEAVVDLLVAPDGKLIATGVTSWYAPTDLAPRADNYLIARFALDPDITLDVQAPADAIPEGTPFSVTTAGSSYGAPGGSITEYVWDTDFNGRSFSGNVLGASPTLTVRDDSLKDPLVLKVTTSDGLQAMRRVPVNVVNVAPKFDLYADSYVPVGRQVTIGGVTADPGADRLTVTVDFGDGSAPATRTVDPLVSRAFSIIHAYATRGTYPLAVTVRDDDGAAAPTQTLSVTEGSKLMMR